jgi:hypothetical protein
MKANPQAAMTAQPRWQALFAVQAARLVVNLP